MHDENKHHTHLSLNLMGITDEALRELTAEIQNVLELGSEYGDYADRWSMEVILDLDGTCNKHDDQAFDRAFGDPDEGEFASFLEAEGLA